MNGRGLKRRARTPYEAAVTTRQQQAFPDCADHLRMRSWRRRLGKKTRAWPVGVLSTFGATETRQVGSDAERCPERLLFDKPSRGSKDFRQPAVHRTERQGP